MPTGSRCHLVGVVVGMIGGATKLLIVGGSETMVSVGHLALSDAAGYLGPVQSGQIEFFKKFLISSNSSDD